MLIGNCADSGHNNKCTNVLGTVSLDILCGGAQKMFCHIREELRLSVFKNRMLRKIFGSKREEAAGDSRKIYNEERHNLYSSTNSF
jgi:hypothetical protein